MTEGPDPLVYRDAAVASTLDELAVKARALAETLLEQGGDRRDPFEAPSAVGGSGVAVAVAGELLALSAAVALPADVLAALARPARGLGGGDDEVGEHAGQQCHGRSDRDLVVTPTETGRRDGL